MAPAANHFQGPLPLTLGGILAGAAWGSEGWGALPRFTQAAVHRAIIKSDCEHIVHRNLSRA